MLPYSTIEAPPLKRKRIDLWSPRKKWNISFPVIWWIKTSEPNEIKYFSAVWGISKTRTQDSSFPDKSSKVPCHFPKDSKRKTLRSNALHSGWMWLTKKEEEEEEEEGEGEREEEERNKD